MMTVMMNMCLYNPSRVKLEGVRSRTGMGPFPFARLPFLDLVPLISLPRGGGVLRQGCEGVEGVGNTSFPVLHFMSSWFLAHGCAVGNVGALNLPPR